MKLHSPKRDVTAEGGAVPGEAHETQPGILTWGRSRRHLCPARPRPQTQEERRCPCRPRVCTVSGQGAPEVRFPAPPRAGLASVPPGCRPPGAVPSEPPARWGGRFLLENQQPAEPDSVGAGRACSRACAPDRALRAAPPGRPRLSLRTPGPRGRPWTVGSEPRSHPFHHPPPQSLFRHLCPHFPFPVKFS